ncbi:hypothetical protein GOODEAATRI_001628 [Goodea atripinnis]|uniref:Uncharacterized protein n=1 Tax=Goodea atripinnis TaxID=208336 RepID=A0ABV0N107_9TELE
MCTRHFGSMVVFPVVPDQNSCSVSNLPNSLSHSTQDEREAREMVKREQDEAYRLSLEADRKKVRCCNP